MAEPAKLYDAIGGAAGCHELARAFYANVALEPILRPLFPSTFKCAIAEFAAFLVQFFGGEAEGTQKRWWLSLRESHARFAIGARERDAWMRAMTLTLDREVSDEGVRAALLHFFGHASEYVANGVAEAVDGELGPMWDEQLALEDAVSSERAEQLDRPALRAKFARSPSLHASFLAAAFKKRALRDWAFDQLRAKPSLAHERYSGGRTLLHDAAGAGDLTLVDLLLDMGADAMERAGDPRSPLYCVGNECQVPGGGAIVRALVGRGARVNAVLGVKRCTALHMAARRGNIEVIAALLDEGADIECRDSAGDTPLRRAVNCEKLEAARLLLARGADGGSVGSKRLTPAAAARSEKMKRLF